MKFKLKFYGKKAGGSFKLDKPADYARHLARFDEGQELEMTLEKKTHRRTQGAPGEATNQNGYLWGVLIRGIADEVGEFDYDEIYNWVQIATGNFKVMPDGQKIPAGTSEMDAGAFQEFCKRVQTWAALPGNVCEKGLYLPDPHEAEYDQ